MHSKPFQQWLQEPDSTLDRLRRRCEQLQRVDDLVRRRLPAPLRDHCRVASLRAATLVLLADSPVWGNLLRYQLPALRQALQDLSQGPADLPPVAHIQVKVHPALSLPEATPPQRLPLRMSVQTGALIASLAQGIEDPALRRAVARLARHGGSRR